MISDLAIVYLLYVHICACYVFISFFSITCSLDCCFYFVYAESHVILIFPLNTERDVYTHFTVQSLSKIIGKLVSQI